MNSERLSAALERRHKHRACGSIQESPYWRPPVGQFLGYFCDQQFETDSFDLANGYLEEHQADGREPVTKEWLISVGFQEGRSPTARHLYLEHVTLDDVARGTVSVCDLSDNVTLGTHFRTRDDVRLLCRALRVQLREMLRPSLQQGGKAAQESP